MATKINVNGRTRTVDVEPDMPLLWVLRDELDMKGPKFGCGAGFCGACTVHLDGLAARSCSVPIDSVGGQHITTIEALAQPEGSPHPIQAAWIAEQVPQCGYCQSGMIMATAALLARNPHPTDADIDAEITNICRCGTYPRIRRAIHALAEDTHSHG